MDKSCPLSYIIKLKSILVFGENERRRRELKFYFFVILYKGILSENFSGLNVACYPAISLRGPAIALRKAPPGACCLVYKGDIKSYQFFRV